MELLVGYFSFAFFLMFVLLDFFFFFLYRDVIQRSTNAFSVPATICASAMATSLAEAAKAA